MAAFGQKKSTLYRMEVLDNIFKDLFLKINIGPVTAAFIFLNCKLNCGVKPFVI